MSLKLSKEFVVMYDGEIIARCVDFDFEINKTVIDLTTLDSDSWRELLADMKEWRINFNALIARSSATVNYSAMLADIKNNDDPLTVIVGPRPEGSDIQQGEALITQLRFRAAVGERAGYSGVLEGTGPIATETMPAYVADFLTFTLPGQTGSTSINDVAKTVAIDMPNGSDVTALAATFTTTANVLDVRISTKVQESEVTENDFTGPVVYTLKAGDLATEDWTVTVTVL